MELVGGAEPGAGAPLATDLLATADDPSARADRGRRTRRGSAVRGSLDRMLKRTPFVLDLTWTLAKGRPRKVGLQPSAAEVRRCAQRARAPARCGTPSIREPHARARAQATGVGGSSPRRTAIALRAASSPIAVAGLDGRRAEVRDAARRSRARAGRGAPRARARTRRALRPRSRRPRSADGERRLVDDGPAGGVDQVRRRLHLPQARGRRSGGASRGVSGQCSETTSAVARSSSSVDAARVELASSAGVARRGRVDDPHAERARPARRRPAPICPRPTIPSVFPWSPCRA